VTIALVVVLPLTTLSMFCAISVCDAGVVLELDVLRANVRLVAELLPALVAALTVVPVTLVPSLVPVIAALSAQSDVSVCVALELSVDETSGLAPDTLRVQTPPDVEPQVPLLFIATDRFSAVMVRLPLLLLVGTRT
jgi:hypothetical protein